MDANPLSVRYAPFHKETLEALFAAQPRWVIDHVARMELAWPALQGSGLDLERARQDMKAAELTRVIRQDIEDAVKLNVTKTPEFFMNGRPMPSFGYEELETLVGEALRDAYR